MITQFPDSPGVLNSYAWRMAEIETNMEDALQKVKRAVQLAAVDPQRQANIIDTEAEVLWKLKRFDEAIEAIEGSAGAVNAWVIIFFSVGTFLSASGFVIYSYIKSKNKD